MMTSEQIREKYLSFFESKDHPRVPSDSLVPLGDATVLFTGAGMNQFKDYFLGLKKDKKRATSCQKCFRTGDVDAVGTTASHLTFFEMLGNFSFGDYFKPEAIDWGWEFLTKELNIPEDKLWVSVYEEDSEAEKIWLEQIKIPKERLVRLDAKDNFWPANAPKDGPNGPCGPCSEIYYDYGKPQPGKTCPAPEDCNPACACRRFVEVWNLVFTQFDRQSDGSLVDLPAKNIDTGMGLERLVAVIQDKVSVFETDLFVPLVEATEALLKEKFGKTIPAEDKAKLYPVAEHVRALSFLISDGVVPSNDGRGYVLRMLLRKAVRKAIRLGFTDLFLQDLVPAVIEKMGGVYPEIKAHEKAILQTLQVEEERFRQTLAQKIPLLKIQMEKLKEQGAKIEAVSGLGAQFYDTHGLSYDEVSAVAEEVGLPVPEKSDFDAAVEALQAESREKSVLTGDIFEKDALSEMVSSLGSQTEFLGYEQLSTPAKVVAIVSEQQQCEAVDAPAKVEVILDKSSFYGEGGGQVGDAGILKTAQGEVKVFDTQWVGSVLAHRGELISGSLAVGDEVETQVDESRRLHVAQNHTGTHLLHAALKAILGEHVVQAGSLVAPDHLRFDFSHNKALSVTEKRAVEDLVNEWIQSQFEVAIKTMSFDEARAQGAMALFGEKYGEEVRVVSIGDVSKELCGGTHLHTSGEVGVFSLVEEGSVAAGVRRIEALTSQKAVTRLKSESDTLHTLANTLKTPAQEVPEAVERLLQRVKSLEQEMNALKLKGAQDQAKDMTAEAVEVGGIMLLVKQVEAPDHGALRQMADALKQSHPEAVALLCDADGKTVLGVGKKAQEQGAAAGSLFKAATAIAGGSGGGKEAFAQGKLLDVSVLTQVKEKLQQELLQLS